MRCELVVSQQKLQRALKPVESRQTAPNRFLHCRRKCVRLQSLLRQELVCRSRLMCVVVLHVTIVDPDLSLSYSTGGFSDNASSEMLVVWRGTPL
jgi:hypothetical protein